MTVKKTCQNGAGWNKGRSQGVKRPFTLAETQEISRWLIAEKNWHDLALLSLALDSLFRSVDLLQLQVRDVIYHNGQIRSTIAVQQKKTKRPVYPELTEMTQTALERWIILSKKQPHDFLFTRTKVQQNPKPITRKHLSSMVKTWAVKLGHPPDDFASHSLRRTKGVVMYEAGERVADISKAYGHASEASTLSYLGIDQKRVGRMCRKYQMTVNLPKRI